MPRYQSPNDAAGELRMLRDEQSERDDGLEVRPRNLAIAFWCAVVPLGLGCMIFLSWSATRWAWLPMLGLVNILLGTMLFFVGVFHLVMHFLEVRQSQPARMKGVLAGLGIALLLMLNFPACAAILSAVEGLESARWNDEQLRRSWIRILNASDQTVDSVDIAGPEGPLTLRSIAAGEGRTVSFAPTPNATLAFDVTTRVSRHRETVQLGDQTEGFDDIALVIGHDGSLTLIRLAPRPDIFGTAGD